MRRVELKRRRAIVALAIICTINNNNVQYKQANFHHTNEREGVRPNSCFMFSRVLRGATRSSSTRKNLVSSIVSWYGRFNTSFTVHLIAWQWCGLSWNSYSSSSRGIRFKMALPAALIITLSLLLPHRLLVIMKSEK